MKNKKRHSKVVALLLAVMFILAGTMTALAEVSEPAGTVSEQVAEAEVSDTNLDGCMPCPPCPPPCPVTVTVSFNMHGHGVQVEPQSWWSWVYVTEPDTPVEEGWDFEGWYADANYNEGFQFDTFVFCDTTVHAKWKKIVTKHTVSFEMNGHGEQVESQEVEDGKTANRPDPEPAEEGWEFEGWFADEGLTAPFDFGTKIHAVTTIYAKWEEKKDPPTPVTKHTVSFEMNGHGGQVPPQSVEEGKNATEPDEPKAEGWKFEGWFADKGLENIFSFDTPITAPTIIYAKWTANMDPPTDPSYPTYPVNPTSSPSSGNGPALSMPETSPVETAAEPQLDVVPHTGSNLRVILAGTAVISGLLLAGVAMTDKKSKKKKNGR